MNIVRFSFARASVEVNSSVLNGSSTNAIISWTTLTNWNINIVLAPGANTNSFQGYGRTNNLLTNAFDSSFVTYEP